MTRGGDIERDLGPDADVALVALVARLDGARPVPAAGFRGELRRRLAGAGAARPARLGALIGAFGSSGALLLLAGALSAAGLGPLAA